MDRLSSNPAFFKICIPHRIFSCTLNLKVSCLLMSLLKLIVLALMLLLLCLLLQKGKDRDIQNHIYISQLGFSPLFVCFLYKPCWDICMIKHFSRCSWMGLGSFYLYSGLSISQLCTGQRTKFSVCFVPAASTDSQIMQKFWDLPIPLHLGTEIKTYSMTC